MNIDGIMDKLRTIDIHDINVPVRDSISPSQLRLMWCKLTNNSYNILIVQQMDEQHES